jgi:hypothetical protein
LLRDLDQKPDSNPKMDVSIKKNSKRGVIMVIFLKQVPVLLKKYRYLNLISYNSKNYKTTAVFDLKKLFSSSFYS